MTDAGYTLTETLAAMAVISLAVGGLSLGAQVIGGAQLRTAQVVSQLQSLRDAQERLETLMGRGAPFVVQRPEDLSGDASGFRFTCAAAAPCEARLAASDTTTTLTISRGDPAAKPMAVSFPGAARFVYRNADAASDAWPPSGPTRQALRSVSLVTSDPKGEAAILVAKVWSVQLARCGFDPITQDCR